MSLPPIVLGSGRLNEKIGPGVFRCFMDGNETEVYSCQLQGEIPVVAKEILRPKVGPERLTGFYYNTTKGIKLFKEIK